MKEQKENNAEVSYLSCEIKGKNLLKFLTFYVFKVTITIRKEEILNLYYNKSSQLKIEMN